jgi:MFS family permease
MLALKPQLATDAPATGDRAVRFVLAAVFALDALTTLIITGYGNSYLLKTLDAPPSYPAFALGVYGFVRFVAGPAGGWLTDHSRPVVAVAVAGGLQVAGVAVMLAFGTAEAFVAGAAILSAGTTLMWLLVFRALADSVMAAERGVATAYLGLTSAVSIGAGFAAAALLAESASSVVFITGIVLGCVSAGLLSQAFGTPIRRRSIADSSTSLQAVSGPPARAELAAATVVFMHFLAVNATVVAFSPFALELLDLTLLKLTALLAPAALAGGLAMLLAGRRSQPGRRMREAMPLYALGAVALLLATLASDWIWFGTGMVAVGIAMGGTTPLLNSSRIDLSTAGPRPGQVLGRLIFAEGLGSVVGPILIGLVISTGDIRAGAVVAAAAFAVLALLTGAASRAVRL